MNVYIIVRTNHREGVVVADVHKADILRFTLFVVHMVTTVIICNCNMVPYEFNVVVGDHVHEHLIALQFCVSII